MRAWRQQLDWDVTESWRSLEPARLAGRLPGFIVKDDSSRVRGWACFLVHQQTLQVAALVADSSGATAALVRGVMTSAEAAKAETAVICLPDVAPGLDGSLRAQGFKVACYRYLAHRLSPVEAAPRPARPGRPWQSEDLGSVARLLAAAYEASSSVRAFAPHDTPDEWQEYAGALVRGPGCGRLLPHASFVVPGSTPGLIDAAVITTRLSDRTAHIAQLAVAPMARGAGLARHLLREAANGAMTSGCGRMTLLVAEDNRPAARLYDVLGFREEAAFVVGVARRPRSA
jgi:ribosomal protein S18 acetylase RimI-like enzyme